MPLGTGGDGGLALGAGLRRPPGGALERRLLRGRVCLQLSEGLTGHAGLLGLRHLFLGLEPRRLLVAGHCFAFH